MTLVINSEVHARKSSVHAADRTQTEDLAKASREFKDKFLTNGKATVLIPLNSIGKPRMQPTQPNDNWKVIRHISRKYALKDAPRNWKTIERKKPAFKTSMNTIRSARRITTSRWLR